MTRTRSMSKSISEESDALPLTRKTPAKKRGVSLKKQVAAQATAVTSETIDNSTTIGTGTRAAAIPWYYVFTKGDAEYNHYMATEWSFEKRGDRALFEKMSLEGAQSGLSWLTILRKREAYRRAFFNFEPNKVASMTSHDVQRIIDTEAESSRDVVVRHRGKIEATIHNARCLLEMQKEAGDDEAALDRFLWSFVDDKPILNRWGANFNPLDYGSLKDCPAQTPESQAMSKALKKKGFKFVGPTTCYALMQSTGMVIDHPIHSPEWKAARQRLLSRPGGFQDRNSDDAR